MIAPPMSYNRPLRPADRPAKPSGRPDLWAEGSQKPRFDLLAFARVSLILSRRTARPVLLAVSQFAAGRGGWMADNRLGPRLAASLGQVGRAFPSRDRLAAGLTGIASLAAAAADVAVPPPPVIEKPAYPDLMRGAESLPVPMIRRPRRSELLPPPAAAPDPKPAPPPTPAPATADDFDGPTLAAIRAMIDEMRTPPAVVAAAAPPPAPPPTGRALLTHAVPLTPPEPRDPTLGEALAGHAFSFGAACVGWGTCALVLPVAMVKATLLHLDGEDLRLWS